MEDTIIINFNGEDIEVKKGTTLLSIAREKNVYIPNLCHNDALKPYGVCRMCLVEIEKGGRTRIVTSCNYEVHDEFTVKTDTERVILTRNVTMKLLLARAPNSKLIRELADRLGVTSGELEEVKGDEFGECILCGQCVRACEEVVGVSAIGFAQRGIDRKVVTPFIEDSKTCIGCGSCAYVCPTNYIKMEDKDGKRYIYNWKVALDLKVCKECGISIAPERQLEYIRTIAELPVDFYDLCWNCR